MIAASLSTLFLALVVAASQVERSASESLTTLPILPLVKLVNDGVFNILKLDKIRADYFNGIHCQCSGEFNSPAVNMVVIYYTSVGVGNPPKNYRLIIDSGSSNTWLGADKKNPYVKTSTSRQTPNDVAVNYGTGSMSGTEFIDRITIAPGHVIPEQSIGVAKESVGFLGLDGIMGIGPVDLTTGTLTPDKNASIPTVTDNLKNFNEIKWKVLTLSFAPITSANNSQLNGVLTWGGIDPTKHIGEITYTPITSVPPANGFWGIDASMTYGDNTPIISSTSGVVDTGTTLIAIATDFYNRYTAATGAVLDPVTHLLKITPAQFANLKSLFVHINGVPFEITPNAQLWPRRHNSVVGGTADGLYLVVGDLGTPSKSGIDFILGHSFIERFLIVLDSDNSRVGVGKTIHTFDETN